MNGDVAIYALCIEACGRDAGKLKYAYHENGQQFIQVLNQITKVSLTNTSLIKYYSRLLSYNVLDYHPTNSKLERDLVFVQELE